MLSYDTSSIINDSDKREVAREKVACMRFLAFIPPPSKPMYKTDY